MGIGPGPEPQIRGGITLAGFQNVAGDAPAESGVPVGLLVDNVTNLGNGANPIRNFHINLLSPPAVSEIGNTVLYHGVQSANAEGPGAVGGQGPDRTEVVASNAASAATFGGAPGAINPPGTRVLVGIPLSSQRGNSTMFSDVLQDGDDFKLAIKIQYLDAAPGITGNVPTYTLGAVTGSPASAGTPPADPIENDFDIIGVSKTTGEWIVQTSRNGTVQWWRVSDTTTGAALAVWTQLTGGDIPEWADAASIEAFWGLDVGGTSGYVLDNVNNNPLARVNGYGAIESISYSASASEDSKIVSAGGQPNSAIQIGVTDILSGKYTGAVMDPFTTLDSGGETIPATGMGWSVPDFAWGSATEPVQQEQMGITTDDVFNGELGYSNKAISSSNTNTEGATIVTGTLSAFYNIQPNPDVTNPGLVMMSIAGAIKIATGGTTGTTAPTGFDSPGVAISMGSIAWSAGKGGFDDLTVNTGAGTISGAVAAGGTESFVSLATSLAF